MNTSTSLGMTIHLEGGEFVKPSVSYNDIDPDKDLAPQILRQRETASLMLDDQLKLIVEKVSALSGKSMDIDVVNLMMEMAKKLEELENGLAAATQKISEREVRKRTKRSKSDGDSLSVGGGSGGVVAEQGLLALEETKQS